MASLTNALQELRQERRQAQLHMEKLDQAISVIESLNGVGKARETNQPKRIISAASRRKMAQAQKARWANIRKQSQSASAGKPTTSAAAKRTAPAKRTMSAAARKKIAAAQKARWARVRAQQKAA